MKAKLFSLIVVFILVLSDICVFADEIIVNFPVVGETFDGQSNGEAPAPPWVIPPDVLYGVTVDEDLADSSNKALKLIRAPGMSNEGSNREIDLTLSETLTGNVTFSWKAYIPNNVIAYNDVYYNKQGDADNQGGLRILASDGTEVFYVPYITNSPRAFLRYGVAGSTSTPQKQINLTHNTWHKFRAELRLDEKEMDFYVDDVFDGTYLMQNYSKTTSNIKSLRVYLHRNAKTTLMYMDDITLVKKSVVAFEPDELTLDYTSPIIDYTTRAIDVSGSVSKFLGAKAYFKLISSDSGDIIAELEQDTKYQDGKAAFDFSYQVDDDVSGWHKVIIDSDYITIDESERTTELYIASTDELENLPADFSDLPSDTEEAKNLIRSYIPLLVGGDEARLFNDSDENADYITRYFQLAGKTYSLISDVQSEYMNACLYLFLNTAAGNELAAALENFEAAENYTASEVYNENKDEFLSHFIKQRGADSMFNEQDVGLVLRYCAAMTSLNNAKKSEIFGIVSIYNDIFELDILSDRVAALNRDELFSALYNNSYTEVIDIQTDFIGKVEALEKAEPRPPANSSGGEGGKTSYTAAPADEYAPQVLPPAGEKVLFTDIIGHWAERDIKKLAGSNIVNGYPDGTFRPDNTITRAEVLAMLVRIMNYEGSSKEAPFSDVGKNDWYYDTFSIAAYNNIILGSDGMAMPDEGVTREQLAVMIYRANKISENADTEISFTDSEEISDYAKEAVAYLFKTGVISGYNDGSFRPKNVTTRAEAARLLEGLTE